MDSNDRLEAKVDALQATLDRLALELYQLAPVIAAWIRRCHDE
jgi:hypothetical protein